MKNIIKNTDLRTQLTNELKTKWYFKDYADRLEIEKEKVTFDKDFVFTLKESEFEPLEMDGEIYEFSNRVNVLLNGDKVSGEDFDMSYSFDDYDTRPNHILEEICLYIANYI